MAARSRMALMPICAASRLSSIMNPFSSLGLHQTPSAVSNRASPAPLHFFLVTTGGWNHALEIKRRGGVLSLEQEGLQGWRRERQIPFARVDDLLGALATSSHLEERCVS
jgi:hypothetical protein